jgi:hypothetical protein
MEITEQQIQARVKRDLIWNDQDGGIQDRRPKATKREPKHKQPCGRSSRG